MDDGRHPAFGQLLRQARRSAGLTHESLAERAGLSVRGISDLERGVIRAPRRETLEMLADALDLSSEEREAWEEVRRRLSVRASSERTSRAQSTIPAPLTPLIGREREVRETTDLLRRPHVRLVTLTGPGGVGKTRVALEVAGAMQPDFPDGVHIVSLAQFSDAELVLPTIATTLQIQSAQGQSLTSAVTDALATRRLLLLLDNMEHVVEAAGDIVEILQHCAHLHVLATSRVPLRLQGEYEYPVAPFTLPPGERLVDVEAVAGNDAVRLFVERAEAVRPGFRLTPENAGIVAGICQRLDGLPLAIELAASQMRMFTPQGLHQRLEHRLPLLVSGAVDVPERHQTLRSTIAWSYDILSSEDQALFRTLSVFRGGWTPEAAESVISDSVLPGIERLVEQSLVWTQPQPDGEIRFGMLETIREFSVEQLRSSGEETEARDRHAAYIVAFAERVAPHLEMADQASWVERLDIESGNLIAALEWIRERKAVEQGLKLVNALRPYWYLRGDLGGGFDHIVSITSMPECAIYPGRCIDALNAAALLAREYGDLDGAYRVTRQSLTLCHQLNDRKRAADAVVNLGYLSLERGDIQDAEALFQRSLTTNREIDNQQGIADSLSFLALTAYYRNDLQTARQLNEESLEIWTRLDDRHGTIWAGTKLGMVLLAQGAYSEAYLHYRKSLETARDLSFQLGMAWALEGISHVCIAQGDVRLAARLIAAVVSIQETVGMRLSRAEQAEHDRLLRQIRSAIGESSWGDLWAQRDDWTLDELIGAIDDAFGRREEDKS